MDKFKLWISALGGILAAYFKTYLPLVIVVLVAVLLDIVTGATAAVYTGEGLSSKKARRGALKKATMFFALGFGIFLDFLVPMAVKKVGLSVDTELVFSSVIAFYIAFCECVSVAENICRCNPSAVPSWIKKLLADSRDNIGKGRNV